MVIRDSIEKEQHILRHWLESVFFAFSICYDFVRELLYFNVFNRCTRLVSTDLLLVLVYSIRNHQRTFMLQQYPSQDEERCTDIHLSDYVTYNWKRTMHHCKWQRWNGTDCKVLKYTTDVILAGVALTRQMARLVNK